MSRTWKAQLLGVGFRTTRGGHKMAKQHNLRSIPPDTHLEDIKADKQCYDTSRIIEKMFNAGVEIEQIENKMRARYKIPHWAWKNIFGWIFDPTIYANFVDVVALNEDKTKLIPISTPNAEPYMVVKLTGLPINDVVIITENKLFRLHIEEYVMTGHFTHELRKIDKVYPFPNKKLTKMLLFLRNHYTNNGMIYKYEIQKWPRGLDKCVMKYENANRDIHIV